jgi:adenylate cyclase
VTGRSAIGNVDPIKAGKMLGVRYVLEGQVWRIRDQVRISFALIETERGFVVGSDRIDQPFSRLPDLLDSTASRIAASVFGRVEDADITTARRKPPENMSACPANADEPHVQTS